MSYKSPEYYAIERNLAKNEAMKRLVDRARVFNLLKLAETVTLTGKRKFEDRPEEISISGHLLAEVLEMCVDRSIKAAEDIHHGEWEANDFRKAASV